MASAILIEIVNESVDKSEKKKGTKEPLTKDIKDAAVEADEKKKESVAEDVCSILMDLIVAEQMK